MLELENSQITERERFIWTRHSRILKSVRQMFSLQRHRHELRFLTTVEPVADAGETSLYLSADVVLDGWSEISAG